VQVTLIRYTADPVQLATLAAKACTSESLHLQVEGNPKLVDSVYESGHESILEHIVFTFGIEGVSRACSHQLVRHRLANFSQQSQRYVEVGDNRDVDWIVPPSIRDNPQAMHEFKVYIDDTLTGYQQLLNLGIPAEDARFLLPNATPTNLVMTVNLRELIHICELRMCCYDNETEVLTYSGWKPFREVDGTEMFYSLNPETETCELVHATHVVHEPYSGDMVSVNGQSVDLLVTPNHKNLMSYSYDTKRFELYEASEALNRKVVLFKKDCLPIQGDKPETVEIPGLTIDSCNQYGPCQHTLDGRQVSTKDLLRFMGFYLSDGYSCKSGYHCEVGICKGSKKLVEQYAQVLQRLTPNTVRVFVEKSGAWKAQVTDRVLYEYLVPLGKAETKHCPQWVWKLDHSLLEYLYGGLLDGDTNRYNGIYSSSSLALASDVQRLYLHLGYSATIGTTDRRGHRSSGITKAGIPYDITTRLVEYRVSPNHSKNEPIIKNAKRNGIRTVSYEGLVHCVELERNHIVYVRRNGKTVWSGNSRSQWEIRQLVSEMRYEVDKVSPEVAKYLVPQCERLGFCPEKKGCGRYPQKGN
jgi:thymidylate synthase (FAD)